jgi:hypothetical protein
VLDRLNVKYVTHFTDQTGNLQTQWDQSSGIILSGTDNILQNSTILWSAGNGVVVIGRNNRVWNNTVHDTNYNATDGGAIGTGIRPSTISEDIQIGYNTVYNTGIDGIEIGALKNFDPNNAGKARVHHNLIHDTVLQSADSGAIHTFSSDGQWVRIDHNTIYNTGPTLEGYIYFGIYLDYAPNDGNSPGRYIIDHNVIYNTPSSLNLNHANTAHIYNNTLISSTLIARSSISSNGGSFDGVIIRNNLGNTEYRGVGTGATLNNNITNVDLSVFVDATNHDPAKRDYRVKAPNPTI